MLSISSASVLAAVIALITAPIAAIATTPATIIAILDVEAIMPPIVIPIVPNDSPAAAPEDVVDICPVGSCLLTGLFDA